MSRNLILKYLNPHQEYKEELSPNLCNLFVDDAHRVIVVIRQMRHSICEAVGSFDIFQSVLSSVYRKYMVEGISINNAVINHLMIVNKGI